MVNAKYCPSSREVQNQVFEEVIESLQQLLNTQVRRLKHGRGLVCFGCCHLSAFIREDMYTLCVDVVSDMVIFEA